MSHGGSLETSVQRNSPSRRQILTLREYGGRDKG